MDADLHAEASHQHLPQGTYETEEVQEVEGNLHHNAPALCIVSWKDPWELRDTVRKLQHLDGDITIDVMSIDQRALTSVTRRLF